MERKWRPHTSIKLRIILSFATVILFVASLLAGIVVIQISLSRELNNIYSSSQAILTLSEEVQSLKSLTEQYLSTKTTTSLEGIHDIINSLSLTAYEMKKMPPDSQMDMKIRDIGYMTEGLTSHVYIALRAKMDANIDLYTESFGQIILLTDFIDLQCGAVASLIAEENIQIIRQHDHRQFRFYGFAVLFTLIMAMECVVYIVFSSRDIAGPIIKMADQAKDIAAGNFDAEDVVCTSRDEVSALVSTFNQMKSDIRRNIHEMEKRQHLELALIEKESENYRMELMLRDAQLVAMQSQIQPHFLFNTINAGLQIAYCEGANITLEYFSQMSDLLRYSLQNFWEPVSLRLEVEQVYRYFYIMEKRFGDRIQFDIQEEIDKPVQTQIVVPCMILQPLVENCYTHGVKNVQRLGKIRITLCEYQGRYAVRIADNGCGMSKELIQFLLNAPAASEQRGSLQGLGVRNVLERLRNYYGRGDVMKIRSKEGYGTEIILLLKEAP